MVEKMIKGPQIHPNKGHYAESNAVAIKANIMALLHKYEKGKKETIKTFLSID